MRSLAGLLLAGITVSAYAQSLTDLETDLDAGLALKRAWSIEPGISLTGAFTDNVRLSQSNKESDLITTISPNIRIKGDTSHVKVNADYSLNGLVYTNNSSKNQFQHALNANGTLEVVDNWLYLDANGVVTQQLISAFGTQSADNSSINANSTQTSNFLVSPYIKGYLRGLADYQLRYSRSWTQADSSSNYDMVTDQVTGVLKGDTTLAKLGWSIDASLSRYDYSDSRQSQDNRLRGFLTYRFDPQIMLSANLGKESNDFATPGNETYDTHGFGFDWRPTQRTVLAAALDKRFFGNGHTFKFSHRTPLGAIQFTDSRDVSVLPNQLTSVVIGNIYDLLSTQLASSIPNEVERDAFIRSYLVTNNIPLTTQVSGGFLASQASLKRRQELSYLLRGVRNVVTLAATSSNDERLSSAVIPGEDFGIYSSVAQKAVSANWSHSLNPLSSLGVNLTYTKNKGDKNGGLDDSSLRKLTATYTTSLGARTTASLGFRHSEFSGSVAEDYSENAVLGTLAMTF